VEALRELVVVPRWLRASFLECGGMAVPVAVDVGEQKEGYQLHGVVQYINVSAS
jgi:hypothetical protein